MQSNAKKVFYYHADANSLGGFIEEPFQVEIPNISSISLPAVGGYVTHRSEALNFKEIISCRSAYTRVSGRSIAEDGPWSTQVTCVIEGLNILENITAKRIVSQISVEHSREGGEMSISFAGSRFEELRVGGAEICPRLNPRLMGTGSEADNDPSRITWPALLQSGHGQAREIVRSVTERPDRSGYDWALQRYGWMDQNREQKKDGCVLCSLVDGVEGTVPGKTIGHFVEIPDFGRIFLGEVLAFPNSIQLTMVRAELGCNVHGKVSAGSSSYQRQNYASVIASGLLAALCVSGCHTNPRLSPEATYQKIHKEFLRGDLSDAQQDAREARNQFSGRNRNWDIKFRLLEAEILTYQGNSDRVVHLLEDYHPTPFAAADIEIKRQLLLSLANNRLNQANQSNHELQTAQQLSVEDDSALQGEVLQTAGLIEFHRDQLASASDSFQRSLDFARQHGDKFLETSDLMNLGTVALRYEEYDEALARFEDASQIARSTGARLALELALGNAGSAYYKLGDFEKSLFNFQQAEQQAKGLGPVNDQIVWSTYTGSVVLSARRFEIRGGKLSACLGRSSSCE